MPKILLIDDNDSFRKMLAEMLIRAGHEILEAENGIIGIDLFNKNPGELVITDMYMPKKNGQEVIIELRKNYPNVKIIAISGGGDRGSMEFLKDTRNLGADKYLSKPFTMKKLLETVGTLLQ
ncbi:MAG: response regulator [Spirochaetales bacterium]|nr:response regulator [Spirochaetales bacterium]